MEPRIHYTTTEDGVRIAYATFGAGEALIQVSGWISPFIYMAHDSQLAEAFAKMAAGRQLVLYDRRGTGMSDRDVTDFSRGTLIKDIEAVTSRLKQRRVALHALDMTCPVALEYAFRHPENVSHLILYGPYVRGPDLVTPETRQGLLHLFRGRWDFAAAALAVAAMPGADPGSARRYSTALMESCSSESAALQMEAGWAEDVTSLLPAVRTPTLVLHSRGDRTVPFAQARELAALMPHARLVPFESDTHFDVRVWDRALEAIDEFLPSAGRTERTPARQGADRSGLHTVLFTDIEGSTALTQRLGDAAAQEVLRAHNAIVRDALQACGGTEIKHTGDGIMASFPSASQALECAIAIQRAVAGQTETPFRVRVGVNAGEPVAEERDLFGTAVQLARRVCDRAEGGQVLVPDVVRQLVSGKGFLFADTGEVALKGFEDPVRLHEVRWRD